MKRHRYLTMTNPETPRLEDIALYAWVGEDELGSGEIGLKQALVPAGCIPLVAISRDKASQSYIREQMEQQARIYGKRIRLVKFSFSGVILETEAGS